MSGVSRQFLNLIVDHGFPGVRSFCRIDLTLHQLFHPTASPHPPNGAGPGATTAAGLTMESLPIPHLSAMDSQPQLVGAWEELCLPEQWKECKDPQFVNLGSGRFCVARFFPTAAAGDLADGSSSCKDFAVLTGVEVVPQQVRDDNGNGGNGNSELGMVPHKSRRVSGASIEALF